MIQKYFICLLILVLWGCAPSRDFSAAPQQGAQRSDIFPRFSDRPEAETSQFTESESLHLGRELEGEVKKLRRQGNQRPSATKNAKAQAAALREEAAQTLRQIEQGETVTQP